MSTQYFKLTHGLNDPSLDQLVSLLMAKKLLQAEYKSLGFVAPKDLDEEVISLTRKARSAYRSELEDRLESAKQRARDLMPKADQREEAEAEVARLTAELEGK
jgi:hypothetical protein